MDTPKMALVHEWLEKFGGSENVVDAIYQSTNSDLYCLWDNSKKYPHVTESWLSKTPLRRHKTLAMPFMPHIWKNMVAKQDYELILSSSHLFAHQARFVNIAHDVPRLAYVHTPARYVWEPDLDPRGRHPLARLVSRGLKPMDKNRASELNGIAANSEFIAQRIRHAWDRESVVIYPPVNTDYIREGSWRAELTPSDLEVMGSLPKDFILGASRFVQYKRLDQVIHVGNLTKTPVVLAGGGNDFDRLQQCAREAAVPVVFIKNPSSALLYALYEACRTYVFPPVEDFGIMPVEAMAAGASILVNEIGGAAESVVHGSCGAHVDFASSESIRTGFDIACSIKSSSPQNRSDHFSLNNFQKRTRDWLGNYHPGFKSPKDTDVAN